MLNVGFLCVVEAGRRLAPEPGVMNPDVISHHRRCRKQRRERNHQAKHEPAHKGTRNGNEPPKNIRGGV